MTYLVLLAVSLLLSAIGFWRYIYFFSVGYGFAVAGIGITLLILFHAVLTPVSCIACILFIIYGVRLGGYLMIREVKSAAYNKILKPENDRSKTIPAGVKIAIWVSCAILYFLQTSPVIFRLENAAKAVADGMASVHIEPNAATDAFTIDLQSFIPADNIAAWIGLCLMALGILLEIAADAQKTVAKKKNPDRFVDSGLYHIRHVQRRAASGVAAGPQLRRRSGLSEVCQDRADHDPAHSSVQREELEGICRLITRTRSVTEAAIMMTSVTG